MCAEIFVILNMAYWSLSVDLELQIRVSLQQTSEIYQQIVINFY